MSVSYAVQHDSRICFLPPPTRPCPGLRVGRNNVGLGAGGIGSVGDGSDDERFRKHSLQALLPLIHSALSKRYSFSEKAPGSSDYRALPG